MTEIKPIETVYKGYRFRSRLEARWAVFLDSLGLQWYYEYDGFNVKSPQGTSLGYYLPDFYLPNFQAYFEVKPLFPTEREMSFVAGLSHMLGWDKDSIDGVAHPGEVAGIFWGLPCENPGTFYLADTNDSGGGCGWWDVQWGLREDIPYEQWTSPGDEAVIFELEPCRADRYICTCGWQPLSHFNPIYVIPDNFSGNRWKELRELVEGKKWPITQAIARSRSARFEHGETGES
jgi:hypothetical protein